MERWGVGSAIRMILSYTVCSYSGSSLRCKLIIASTLTGTLCIPFLEREGEHVPRHCTVVSSP
jgi:hypothetical protein